MGRPRGHTDPLAREALLILNIDLGHRRVRTKDRRLEHRKASILAMAINHPSSRELNSETRSNFKALLNSKIRHFRRPIKFQDTVESQNTTFSTG